MQWLCHSCHVSPGRYDQRGSFVGTDIGSQAVVNLCYLLHHTLDPSKALESRYLTVRGVLPPVVEPTSVTLKQVGQQNSIVWWELGTVLLKLRLLRPFELLGCLWCLPVLGDALPLLIPSDSLISWTDIHNRLSENMCYLVSFKDVGGNWQ